MDAVRTPEFLFALAGFWIPTAIAAWLVYRRLLKSRLCRQRGRARLTDERIQRLAETPEAPAAPAPAPVTEPAAPATAAVPAAARLKLEEIRQPLENLRLRLVEFRASIQEANAALGKLQDSDCRFSMDLARLSETMRQAYATKAAPVKRQEDPRDDVSSAA